MHTSMIKNSYFSMIVTILFKSFNSREDGEINKIQQQEEETSWFRRRGCDRRIR